MGWFDEQIRQRKQNDDEVFATAFADMAAAVMGEHVGAALRDERAAARDAVNEILRFYHAKGREVPSDIKDVDEQLEYLLRPHGIMRRTVKLEQGWYKDAVGAMLGVRISDSRPVAFIPTGLSGYSYFDPETKKYKKINRKTAQLFSEEAIAFYKPFPMKKLSIPSLMRYILEMLSPGGSGADRIGDACGVIDRYALAEAE